MVTFREVQEQLKEIKAQLQGALAIIKMQDRIRVGVIKDAAKQIKILRRTIKIQDRMIGKLTNDNRKLREKQNKA